mgnify:CR=1 FL=1
MLEIKDLQASIGGNEILRGLSFQVNPGEVHAIMGPNGSGKSTLAQCIAGNEAYEVTGGSIRYPNDDLLELEPEERARRGVLAHYRVICHVAALRLSLHGHGVSSGSLAAALS